MLWVLVGLRGTARATCNPIHRGTDHLDDHVVVKPVDERADLHGLAGLLAAHLIAAASQVLWERATVVSVNGLCGGQLPQQEGLQVDVSPSLQL